MLKDIMTDRSTPDNGFLITTRFIPSGCELNHGLDSIEKCIDINENSIRKNISRVVRFSIKRAIVEILGNDIEVNYEIGKSMISFDYITGIYTVTSHVIPSRICKSVLKNVGTEVLYRLVENKTRLRKAICKHVNSYVYSNQVLKKFKAKVGIHTFDELVFSCEKD